MKTSISSLKTLPPKLVLALALAEKSRRTAKIRERHLLLPAQASTEVTSLVLQEGHPLHDLLRPARYKVYYGGRGGTKSWGFAEALIRRAAKEAILVLCTREKQNSIEDSVHRLLVNTIARLKLNAWFVVTKTSIRSKCGAEFKFKGLRELASEDVKSYEAVDICWVEEANSVSLTSWKTLRPTIRKPGSEIWLSFNPVNEEDPCWQLFVKNPEPGSIIHYINFDSNPYMSAELEGERQADLRLIANAENEQERKQAQSNYDHTWLGKFKRIDEAIVFSGKWIEESFPDDLWKESQRPLLGADFGFAQDPNTLIRGFILEDKEGFKDLYIEYEAYGVGVELEEMEEFYGKVPGSKEWSIKADSARPETISFLARKGFRISAAEKWQGSIEDGITHIRAFRRIVIHPRCKHTIEEAKLYSYKRDKVTDEVLPIIIDKHNHCWDAIRYSLDGYIQRRGTFGVWAALGKNYPIT